MDASTRYYDELINPFYYLQEQEWMQRWLTSSLDQKQEEYDKLVEHLRKSTPPREISMMTRLTKYAEERVGNPLAADVYRKLALMYLTLRPDNSNVYEKMLDFADIYILLVNRFLQVYEQDPINFVTEIDCKLQYIHPWYHEYQYNLNSRGEKIFIIPIAVFDREIVTPFYDRFNAAIIKLINQGFPGFSIQQSILYFVAHKMVAECLIPRLLSKVL